MADAAAQARSLAAELFSGRLSPSAHARTSRVQALMVKLLGPEGLAVKDEGERRRVRHKFPRLHMTAKHRTEAIVAAVGLIQAFLSRRFEEIDLHAQAVLHFITSNGALARHRKGPLIEAMKRMRGEIVAAEPKDVRAYALNELMTVVPRGIGEAVGAHFDAPNGVVVTAALDDRRGTSLRVAIMTSPNEHGEWRAHNLPFPTIDDAVRAGARAKAVEEEWLMVADRIVRHFVLGHVRQVRSLRNLMADRLLFSGDVIEAEALSQKTSAGPSTAERLELVFLGTEKSDCPPAIRDRLRKSAHAAWRRPIEKLTWKVARTRIGALDPEKGRIAKSAPREAVSLLLGQEESETVRWRFAGLFL